MHFSSQEEYGLRCLLRLAQAGAGMTVTINEIARAEKISAPLAAKMMRILREGGLVESALGQTGGYRLVRPPEKIAVKQAMTVLGGDLFGGEFCSKFSGREERCTHSIDCSIRSLWRAVQAVVDQLLSRTTLKDLMCGENEMDHFVADLVVLTDPRRLPELPAFQAKHG